MGKRSNFERIPRDFYPTPPEAVAPLIPHISEHVRFWEPCLGNAALAKAIHERLPMSHWIGTDIEAQGNLTKGTDALTISREDVEKYRVDHFITNPPWSRHILHPLIEHLSAMLPTWLLFDADWMHTKQSAPYMPWLRKVVSVGRVKWIPDSKMTGKDNCAWHLFDQNSTGPTEFIGRQQ